jgi:hypothetical protein
MSEKPLLKLGFIDYFSTIADFFVDTLSKTFDVIRDDNNPDYLIFCDENFGQQNHKFNDRNVIKIFYTGENRRPQYYPCHYSISFDEDNDRNYRLPLYVFQNWELTEVEKLPKINELRRKISSVSEKNGFCSFVVRNPYCQERNSMFHLLSQYKKIDSVGSHLNNMGYVLGGNHSKKLEFLSQRKFSLCYENSSYPGYLTEKLFESLYANTIPIYWGSSTASLEFNPKALISRHDFDSDEQMIARIIELDSDNEQYNAMLREPIFNDENKYMDLNRFNKWFLDVVYKGILNR